MRSSPPDPPAGTASDVMTVEEFARLPDDEWRTELVRGRVVREPPAGFGHGDLAAHLAHRLRSFVRENGLGKVVGAETGFVLFDDPPTVRAPDAAFVSYDRLPDDAAGFAHLAPDLAVEVVSPSNSVAEMQDKATDFLDAGTRLVWIIEPSRRTVTVYRSRSDIALLTEEDHLDGGDVLPGFGMRVEELFQD